MATSGMAVDENALAPPAPQRQAGRAHLLNDVGDRYCRTKVVTDHRNAHAAPIRARRHLRERCWLERAPPATMDEHGKRGLVIVFGREKIHRPPRRRTIRNPKFCVVGRRTISRALALPARKNFRMLGDAGAVVVFDFIVDGHAVSLGNTFGISLVAG